MPRGVYDRSKSKTQRTAEKASAAPAASAAPKRKYTKKASLTPVGATSDGVNKYQGGVQAASELKSYEGVGSFGQSRKNELAGALRLLSEIRPGLNGAFATTALDSLFSKTLGEYEKQLFPAAVQEAATVQAATPAPAPSISNGAPVPAPVSAAPVPFNPPTFAPAPAQG